MWIKLTDNRLVNLRWFAQLYVLPDGFRRDVWHLVGYLENGAEITVGQYKSQEEAIEVLNRLREFINGQELVLDL